MDILIFDMDGVLINVSGSYRKAIQKTVQIYFRYCLGFNPKGKDLITNEEISLFKAAGHFNNDWDLTSGILLYLLSISGLPPIKKKPLHQIEKIISFLREESSKFKLDHLKLFKKKNLRDFILEVKSYHGGIKGIRLALKKSWDGWLYRNGDLNRENIVKRIFQEVYLGNKFREFYKLDPIFYHGKGTYLKEKLLIPKSILFTLRRNIILGIASGRPRFEAELALKRFQLFSYFDKIVTLDDCIEEETKFFKNTGRRISLTKPHPYPILKVIEGIGIKNPKCGYIGDVVDDIIAARRAKRYVDIIAIGFLSQNKVKKFIKDSMVQAGADIIYEKPEDLLKLMTS